MTVFKMRNSEDKEISNSKLIITKWTPEHAVWEQPQVLSGTWGRGLGIREGLFALTVY